MAGVPAGMNNPGLLYMTARALPATMRTRGPCSNRAPPSSEASAMNGLGAIYNEGDGVPRNTKLARQWFEKAAALGIPQAKQNLKGMRR
jgi:Sel1 repeat